MKPWFVCGICEAEAVLYHKSIEPGRYKTENIVACDRCRTMQTIGAGLVRWKRATAPPPDIPKLHAYRDGPFVQPAAAGRMVGIRDGEF